VKSIPLIDGERKVMRNANDELTKLRHNEEFK
jgi:hypothetical protein